MARSKKEIAFQRKVDELVKRANRLEDAEVKKVIQILADARKEVAATIASTEWQAYRLPQFQAAIERAMQEFGDKYGVELRDAQRSFWETGIEMVDLPLRQVGIMAAFPAIDTTALAILQGYGADLVKGLARDAALKINNEILMGLMGQKTPFEVMQAVGRNLKDKSIFTTIAARAETITRTEAGRVLEMASQARLEAAAGLVSGLQKQWLHGEFVRQPRISHLAAAGQIRDVGKPFDVGGEKLMFPRDPAGSAKNTINCHCYTIPYHPDWDRAAPAEGGPEEGRPRERKGERIAVQSVAEAQGEMAEFRKTLTYADERIVSDYTGEKHLQWNRELRRGRLSPENAGPVERLSEILRNAPKLEGEVFLRHRVRHARGDGEIPLPVQEKRHRRSPRVHFGDYIAGDCGRRVSNAPRQCADAYRFQKRCLVKRAVGPAAGE